MRGRGSRVVGVMPGLSEGSARQACQDAEPEPSFCGPLRQFRPVLANVLRKDEDVDGDGELDAFSVCIQAQVAPAALGGL